MAMAALPTVRTQAKGVLERACQNKGVRTRRSKGSRMAGKSGRRISVSKRGRGAAVLIVISIGDGDNENVIPELGFQPKKGL
eukprot:4886760-Pleurochrysis_carterae.AAC.1